MLSLAQAISSASLSTAPAQQIEVTATRDNDSEQRRQSTAAKIVIGREEIERFGDSTLGEVLRRLPGVTTQGRTLEEARVNLCAHAALVFGEERALVEEMIAGKDVVREAFVVDPAAR